MSVGLYIDPPARSLEKDRFFALHSGKWQSSLARCLAYIKRTFEAQGVAVHTADLLPPPSGTDRHVYVSIGNHANYRGLAKRPDVVLGAFLVTEAPIVEPPIYTGLRRAQHFFERIYSCIDRDAITEYVGAEVDCHPLRWPMDFRGVDEERWSRGGRGFLVMININKLPKLTSRELYTERMRAVEYFSRTNEIDLYGVGWDKASLRMGRSRLPPVFTRMRVRLNNWVDRIRPDPLLVAARRVYKGELEEKWDTLASYDFVLCFENNVLPGWLTEKFFEALRVGTVPIYWGATDIKEIVSPDCFIDMREFSGYPELRSFLKSLDAAAIRRYREAGRAFLESPAYEPFTRERFAGIFADLLEAYGGVRVKV